MVYIALFKIYRGTKKNLPSAMTDGYAYFCSDSGDFYIDFSDSTGKLYRKQINAEYASKIRYLSGEEYVEVEGSAIIEAVNAAHQHTAITNAEIDEICVDFVLQENEALVSDIDSIIGG